MLKQMIVAGILALGIVAGCQPTDESAESIAQGTMRDADLVIRSSQGQIMASGTVSLPDPFPVSGAFSGTFQLAIADKQFPADALSPRREYQGDVGDDDRVTINLNPGMMDNNIVLSGELKSGRITGDCELSAFGGPRPLGTFSLHLQSQ